MKYFVGSETHFILFEKNLFKHDQCEHIQKTHQIVPGAKIYKVAGETIPGPLHNQIMNRHIKGEVDLEVMKESTLYKPY